MKRHLYHPIVWDKNGKELFPAPGRIIPEGSIVKETDGFSTLKESIWVLVSDVDDMGRKIPSHYEIAEHKNKK